jgi:peptidoglycan/LPS O-acetylase OafA/YrhL
LLALSLYVTLLASAFLLIEGDLGKGAKKELRYWDGFLGDMSYPLYLLNFPVALWMSKTIIEPAIYVAVSVVVAILIGAIVVSVAETPLKSIRRRLTETRDTTTTRN